MICIHILFFIHLMPSCSLPAGDKQSTHPRTSPPQENRLQLFFILFLHAEAAAEYNVVWKTGGFPLLHLIITDLAVFLGRRPSYFFPLPSPHCFLRRGPSSISRGCRAPGGRRVPAGAAGARGFPAVESDQGVPWHPPSPKKNRILAVWHFGIFGILLLGRSKVFGFLMLVTSGIWRLL